MILEKGNMPIGAKKRDLWSEVHDSMPSEINFEYLIAEIDICAELTDLLFISSIKLEGALTPIKRLVVIIALMGYLQ